MHAYTHKYILYFTKYVALKASLHFSAAAKPSPSTVNHFVAARSLHSSRLARTPFAWPFYKVLSHSRWQFGIFLHTAASHFLIVIVVLTYHMSLVINDGGAIAADLR